METNNTDSSADATAQELRQCAESLLQNIQNNDFQQANEIITQLSQTRESKVFNSVGKLTRALHSAIVNFNVDADDDDTDVRLAERSHISDASDRLNYVLNLTQDAADKTMDKVEACEPIATSISQESAQLREEWRRLKRREMDAEQFRTLYYQMDEFLERIGGGADTLSKNLQEIILEQGYQDLTGQVLKKVILLVSDVESELVNLVRIASQVDSLAGLDHGAETSSHNSTGEGPQIHADKKADVVTSQDEVDDLLSSLGF